VFRDSSNNRVHINALYSVTASAARDGILLDSPFIYKSGLEKTNYSVRTLTSKISELPDQTIYTTYAGVGYVLEQNLIFLNSTIADATASYIVRHTNCNDTYVEIPSGVILELFNSGSNDIYMYHNNNSYTATRIKLSGSVSRPLKTKSSIRFVLDSDGNWYELWKS
jgi:hypothetical protein